MNYKQVSVTDATLVMRMGQCHNVMDRRRRIANAAQGANIRGMRDEIVTSPSSVTFLVPADVPQERIDMFGRLLRQEFTPRQPIPSRYSALQGGRPYGLERY